MGEGGGGPGKLPHQPDEGQTINIQMETDRKELTWNIYVDYFFRAFWFKALKKYWKTYNIYFLHQIIPIIYALLRFTNFMQTGSQRIKKKIKNGLLLGKTFYFHYIFLLFF